MSVKIRIITNYNDLSDYEKSQVKQTDEPVFAYVLITIGVLCHTFTISHPDHMVHLLSYLYKEAYENGAEDSKVTLRTEMIRFARDMDITPKHFEVRNY